MFEFSRFYPTDYEHGREFVADLDKFLGQIPKGWPYAIEMRNKHWLQPDYFACLASHEVAHVLNSWNAMPPWATKWRSPAAGQIHISARRDFCSSPAVITKRR